MDELQVKVAELLWLNGAKMGHGGCAALAPVAIQRVRAGISTDALARFLYENAGTPNKKSAPDIAQAVIRMVGR